MQNKLQELTDKLYNEGLSKGKQEGEELLAKAKAQALDRICRKQESDQDKGAVPTSPKEFLCSQWSKGSSGRKKDIYQRKNPDYESRGTDGKPYRKVVSAHEGSAE